MINDITIIKSIVLTHNQTQTTRSRAYAGRNSLKLPMYNFMKRPLNIES